MLSALTISNVVLIEHLVLEFTTGLNVLTGETGAGKSILLDSLGLALGARGDSSQVRQGQSTASVIAEFTLPDNHAARAFLHANELFVEGTLLLRRVVKADGGSRAFINDQPVSIALLREIGDMLVEIHGQHDERGILNARSHRDLLDSFGKLESLTRRVDAAWQDWRAADAALLAERDLQQKALLDINFIEHAVSEIRNLKPLAGEEQVLAQRRQELQRGQKMVEDLEQVSRWLGGANGAVAQLRQAARKLDRHSDAGLGATLAALDHALEEAATAEDMVERLRQHLAHDPDEFERMEARLFDLRALARKHRIAVDDLANFCTELEAQLAAAAAGDDRLAHLTAVLSAKRDQYLFAAAALTKARQAAARALDAKVTAELKPLKLDSARFQTRLIRLEDARWGAGGVEQVLFEVSTNPGADFGPLARIASGGELSRFLLALKVALATTGNATTLIFDEIDRGVGGAVASAVGERLAHLARAAQILVVTHSPQVAACADHHWLISKATRAGLTLSQVQRLDATARREEIARMLSGDEITNEARGQAQRLIAGRI